MNKTKCNRCNKEINLPDWMDPDWEKAVDLTNKIDKRLEDLDLTDAEYLNMMVYRLCNEPTVNKNDARYDRENGGYYCKECYKKMMTLEK